MAISVLVIDGNAELLDAVRFALSLIGNFVISTAVDGVEGLEKVAEDPPDVVVVDVMMPHLNGLHVIQALRGDPATCDIPIVILSAMVQPRDIFWGESVGCDVYLTKPLDPDELAQAIHDAYQRTQDDRTQRIKSLAQKPLDESS